MKPAAFIIVIAIILGVLLVFAPTSLKGILSAFPPFQAATERAQQTAVAPENATIFRSIDSGKTWFPQVAVDAATQIPPVTVLHIAIDHFDSNIMYAGTEGDGLYTSVNNGQNWEKINDRNGALAANAVVYQTAQDPNDAKRFYVAAFQNKFGVFLKSEDGGVSFVRTYISQLENYTVGAVAIDPVSGNMIYIGTSQGGFFVSEDYGETWQVREWLTGPVADIVVNPENRSEIYTVVSGRGLFRSADGGRTWKAFSTELSRISGSSNVVMFRTDPYDRNTLYLAIANGLVKSDNRGATWKFMDILIPPKTLPVDAIAIDPNDTQRIYVGVAQQLYTSTDGGVNWSVQRFNTAKRISTIVIDPRDSRSMFLGMKNVKK